MSQPMQGQNNLVTGGAMAPPTFFLKFFLYIFIYFLKLYLYIIYIKFIL